MKLKQKTALITGGGSGIGAAVAKRFVQEGATVCIAGRRKEQLDQVAAALPQNLVTCSPGDISNPADVDRMVAAAAKFGNGLDVLVNCAAFNVGGSVMNIDLQDWQRSIDVNLTGSLLLMRAVIPHMLKRGTGSIINVASLAGLRCVPERVAYCSTKAAMIMLTKQAALDYGPSKIRCNIICPGSISTPMTAGWFEQIKQTIGMEKAFKGMPLRRPGEPEEIAAICSFLADEDSSFLTGAVITADGGINVVDAFAAISK